ncbi:hypothetical protein [Cryptosporangium sp. NPDC048952]|uniref:hypothetical protein n=1 Tax=Cryptosporangium sp. NPDC048952 TaxID=3363961 RepID=UPI00371FAF86
MNTPAYVDLDELRMHPHPHRHVHGGFAGTETRFSLYFPPADRYRGRFFQHLTPVPGSEHLAASATGQENKIGFAFGAGGFFLETNGGGTGPSAGHQANPAAAQYARVIAQEIYGEHRVYGYAYGGSGGAYRTIGGAENTTGVWDGFVPYVPGSPVATPSNFTIRLHAQRVLRDRLDDIADAFDAGGTGVPPPDLTEEQREAFAEVTRMGFPVRSWFGHRTMGTHAFGAVYPGVLAADPGYFDEFWTTPGYLGADPKSSVHAARVRLTATVVEIVRRAGSTTHSGGVDEAFKGAGSGPVALRLDVVPGVDVLGAELLAGDIRVRLTGFDRDLAVIDLPDRHEGLDIICPGDRVEIDNSNYLAAQTYHRHQIPGPEYPAWDQFRDAGLPQRPTLLGPLFAAGAAGHVPTGRISGKMILVAGLLDREAFPWHADWYRARVADDQVRLWYVDNALHSDVEQQEHPTRTVSYLGVLHEALRAVSAWVEDGVEPPASTVYSVDDGQVRVAARAADRLGVQPVVGLSAEVSGDSVVFEAVAETPPGGPPIVRVCWDLDGDGHYEIDEAIEPAGRVVLRRHHVYTEPGARFACVRISAQRDGDPDTPFGRIDNLARVRI